MRGLDFFRGTQRVRVAIQVLRAEGIQATGPYRRRNGTSLYTLADCVVTESELLDLERARKLNATGVLELIAKVRKGEPSSTRFARAAGAC
jgi:hypothetical protein